MRDGDEQAAAGARTRWFQNADNIARFLGTINPFWSEAEWRTMLHEHLRLLGNEIAFRLEGDYVQNVAVSDEIERQALAMADMMTDGIARQFPSLLMP